jgi:bifunctional non-homologous end joining protein LigD
MTNASAALPQAAFGYSRQHERPGVASQKQYGWHGVANSRYGMQRIQIREAAAAISVVFDVLFIGGNDLRDKPLLERKKILKALLPRHPLLRYSEHVVEFGTREFAKAERAHEEGVIAKRAAGLY